MNTLKFQIYIFSAFFLLVSYLSKAEEYIKISKDEANIRFSPNTNSTIVAKGMKGDIFELIKTEGDWFEISLFSGEYRYVVKSFAEKVTSITSLTTSTEIKKKIFKELIIAEDKAISEASVKYPNDIDKEIDYQRILDDRYKLPVFRKYSTPPPWYTKLITEGVKNGWN